MFIYSITLFLIAFTTLMLELALARIFDVILTSNMSYMILTSAIFAFGLSGIFVTVRPLSAKQDVRKLLSLLTLLFSASALLLLPIMNVLPFDYEKLTEEPVLQILYFGSMYISLIAPFFLSGLIFVHLFSLFAERIQSLYFWDLTGAALGSIILIPFLPEIGPGGILFCASALALVAFAFLTRIKSYRFIALISGAILILIPFLRSPDYFEFVTHIDKRGVSEANASHKVEYSVWDPVSKIDVIDQTLQPSNGIEAAITRKHIAYDGGTQSSHIYKFDGDFKKLRKNVLSNIKANFWNRGVLASHYLKHDSQQKVLIIGSAAGQETKAALLYNAAWVDAVEMVGAVVALGKGKYADFNGNIFNQENVHVYVDEGRSFIRRSESKYDIIQIFSNHTSSSIASGTGAVQTTYLQTADAYKEYFKHLKPDGILHINHHIFPKMVTTAALAWHNMGLGNFQKHVVIFVRRHIKDNLPTMLIKMEPWQEDEIEELKNFFLTDKVKDGFEYELVEDPIHPPASFLSSEFYSGEFSNQLADRVSYRVEPSTDDRPYFNFLRKSIAPLAEDKLTYTDRSTAMLLNSQLRKDIIPMDIIHFFVIGSISILFTGIFIFIPLSFSKIGKAKWSNKFFSLTYFACLGAGFIIIEVLFIQIFMKLIGSPLYTYSTVIFTMLLSAGLGSLCSKGLKINLNMRWYWPFVGILVACCLLIFAYTSIFNMFMGSTLFWRIATATFMIFPLGFFLGMPFPLGILSLHDKPKGAVAWAWGMNGLFTVVGGFSTILISIFFGFKLTLLLSMLCYGLALATFSKIRHSRPAE